MIHVRLSRRSAGIETFNRAVAVPRLVRAEHPAGIGACSAEVVHVQLFAGLPQTTTKKAQTHTSMDGVTGPDKSTAKPEFFDRRTTV